MHSCWPDLHWNCYSSIFANLQQIFGPWLFSEFSFHSISYEWVNGIWSNLAYALILTRSRLWLLQVNFHKFTTELWQSYGPWLLSEFLFCSNLIKFCICIDLKPKLGWNFTHQFVSVYIRVMALGCCQNFVSAQYLVNESMKYDQTDRQRTGSQGS